MYGFIGTGVDLEQLRARQQKMSDTELRRFGKSTTAMCSAASKSRQIAPESIRYSIGRGAGRVETSEGMTGREHQPRYPLMEHNSNWNDTRSYIFSARRSRNRGIRSISSGVMSLEVCQLVAAASFSRLHSQL